MTFFSTRLRRWQGKRYSWRQQPNLPKVQRQGITLPLMSSPPSFSLRRRRRLLYPLVRMGIALRYPDFRVLWLSTVSNQLGWGMQQVLLGWLVFEMTGNAGMVGAIFRGPFGAQPGGGPGGGFHNRPLRPTHDNADLLRRHAFALTPGILAALPGHSFHSPAADGGLPAWRRPGLLYDGPPGLRLRHCGRAPGHKRNCPGFAGSVGRWHHWFAGHRGPHRLAGSGSGLPGDGRHLWRGRCDYAVAATRRNLGAN